MAAPPMTSVEIRRIVGIEALHEPLQPAVWRMQQKMEVIAHQYIAMHFHFRMFQALFQYLQELLSIFVICKYVCPSVPPASDVVPCSRIFYPQRS
jgi:hypothetical protein